MSRVRSGGLVGYVKGLADIDAPSEYALNLRASGLLITELLNYVCNWRPTAIAVSESWHSGKFMRYDRDNFPEASDPECTVCHHYAGVGTAERLPRPRWFAARRVDRSVPELPQFT